jgi:hypothetical protein
MPQVGQEICRLPGLGSNRSMQLGLWHLTFPKVRVFRSDSDAENLSFSMAILKLLVLGVFLAKVHYSKVNYTMAFFDVKAFFIQKPHYIRIKPFFI